jgi:hypothetical protein
LNHRGSAAAMAPVEGSNEIEFVDRGTGLRADRGRHASRFLKNHFELF